MATERLLSEHCVSRMPGILASAAMLGAAMPGAAWAQAWTIRPQVQATVTATDNARLSDEATARRDLILELAPRVSVIGRGARVNLQADVGFSALGYVNHSLPRRILPNGRMSGQWTVVERWAGLRASAQADQTASDPFAAQSVSAGGLSVLTTTRLSWGPFVEHEFSPSLKLSGQSEFTDVHRGGDLSATDPRRDAHVIDGKWVLQQQPMPLGWSVEVAHQRTRYQSAIDTTLSTASARGGLSLALGSQWRMTALAGLESSRFAGTQHDDPTWGLRLEGSITERSTAKLEMDRRFFGTGWQLDLRHRSPFVSLVARGASLPVTSVTSQTLTASASTASLLDAALTTRFPDPVSRAEQVQDMIRRLGLPAQLSGPVEVFADQPRLERSFDLTAAFLGRLNTVSLGMFASQSRALARADDSVALPGADAQSNRQMGYTLGVNHRLGPFSTASVLLRRSRIEGLAARLGDVSENTQLRLSWSHQLAPRLSVVAALRHQRHISTVAGATSSRENALTSGLAYRY